MGCCGCNQKDSTLTGGILGIIQSIIGIIMASLNIHLFNDGSATLVQVVSSTAYYVEGLLIAFLLLQLVWFLSSGVMIYANMRNNVCGIRQWLVTTSFVIIGEFLLPAAVIALTVNQLYRGTVNQTCSSTISTRFTSTGYTVNFIPGLLESYITLILTFSKGGLITIITNIVFCVFTGKRIKELMTPRTGYVFGQAVPPVVVPSLMAQPYYTSQAPIQPYYVVQPLQAQQQFQVQGRTQQPGNFQAYVPPQAHTGFQRVAVQPSGSTDNFEARPPPYTPRDQTQKRY